MSWQEEIKSPSKIAPTLDNAKRITAADGLWVLGNAVKIMDANTSDKDFIINSISIEYCDIFDGFIGDF